MPVKGQYAHAATRSSHATHESCNTQFMPNLIRIYYRYWFAAPVIGFSLGLLLTYCFFNTGVDEVQQYLLEADGGRALLQGGPNASVPIGPISSVPGPSPKTFNTLRFDNLWQDDNYEKNLFGSATVLQEMMIFVAGTIMVFMVMVNLMSCYILPYFVPKFRELDVFGQMAVTTNLLYVILLCLQLVPYTVIVIGILFGDQKSKQFPAFYYTVFIFLTTHFIMYAYEGIVRSIIKVNYFLLIHHAVFFILVIVEFVNQSNFVVKTSLILDYFVVWECGLFMTNVLYRLNANYILLKWVMIVGTTMHGITHLVQAMLLTAFFVGMGIRMKEYHIHVGIYVFMVVLCFCLCVYQIYLEHIFYIMWIKVATAHRKKGGPDVEEGKVGEPGGPEARSQESNALLKGVPSSSAPHTTRISHTGMLMTTGSIERIHIAEQEPYMLGELPTFPARMSSVHVPVGTILPGHDSHPGEVHMPVILEMTGQPAHAFGSVTASSPPTIVAAPDSSLTVASAPVPVPAAPAPKAKPKRNFDGLTEEMWQMTED
ncbi:hypothetical protein CEUSTIGMA_g3839.t1 [Chlamydomonas eustigma]|uniref:Uncharacterized protein n=1 Tax=Chlamydomonas eustigma TaxID=1157962 RepID=A0A250WZX8_9CHLO|nr:hypothetical protein CEUSTIGMA_g3839.t1 [Chlamydomonas eustigma]|eukprot:GAX76394.1 hypothetical protein CEUSTIGMA_g3839.t1 [Chlamydomonas eustigma]